MVKRTAKRGANTGSAVRVGTALDSDAVAAGAAAAFWDPPQQLLAATGLRLVMTLARQLRQHNLRYGIAAACVGGGQGMALLIENPVYRA